MALASKSKDTVTKEYMQDNETFADVFNFLLYDGEQVIQPQQLKQLDTTQIARIQNSDGTSELVQRYRDVVKVLTVMEDGNTTYLLLGIENQSDIHYAMPVRNMLYDALQYVQQVEETAKLHRKHKDKPASNGEFLSGFYRTDKVTPIITLTIYFGAEEWDAPRTLHEMLSVQDERILKYVPDYKMNLIAPAEIADEDFAKFHTELNVALKYIKYSKDARKLEQVLENDLMYRSVSARTVNMVNTVTDSQISYPDREEKVDMCKAIEDLKAESMVEGMAEGMAKGMAEGMAEGMAKGKAEGVAEGMTKGILSTLCDLVKKGQLTVTQAAQQADMSEQEFMEKVGLKQ